MHTLSKQLITILAAVLITAISSTVKGQTLPKNVAKIDKNVYSYSLDGEYFSMFIVTTDGVIAIESINSMHAKGMVEVIKK